MSDPADSFASARVTAGVVARDQHGRVLLVHPTYKPGYDLPGGMVEHGEAPSVACRRELAEELGVDRPPRRFLSVDWLSDERGDRVLFLFSCDPIDDAEIVLDGDELDAWCWVDPADYLPESLLRRVRATIAGDSEGGLYLERGQPTLPDPPTHGVAPGR